MQCVQCKTNGFIELNHLGMCQSCAKAMFESNVRNAHAKRCLTGETNGNHQENIRDDSNSHIDSDER